jgi:hypothetical protein
MVALAGMRRVAVAAMTAGPSAANVNVAPIRERHAIVVIAVFEDAGFFTIDLGRLIPGRSRMPNITA